ncbi:hypothetical protein PHYC_01607 [Phycisphaerales bacterium]|nr:hypothetical protein PHYC_01607 [Phycisphaerales bacterium]
MKRAIAAVVLSIISMWAILFFGGMVVMLVIGPESAFKPGLWEWSTTWVVVNLVLDVSAAVVGGFLCSLIARRQRPVFVLAGIVLVSGLVVAIIQMTNPHPDPGPRTISLVLRNWESMKAMSENSLTPLWVQYANTVIGIAGVLAGGRLKKPGDRDALD